MCQPKQLIESKNQRESQNERESERREWEMRNAGQKYIPNAKESNEKL